MKKKYAFDHDIELGQDSGSRVVQASFPRTDLAFNLSDGEVSGLFEGYELVRVIASTGDAWINIASADRDEIASLTAESAGLSGFNTSYTVYTGYYESSVGDIFIDEVDGKWIMYDNALSASPAYINDTKRTTNPPTTGWRPWRDGDSEPIGITLTAGDSPAPSLTYTEYTDAGAVDTEGMLLPQGYEITICVDKHQTIAVIGSDLNITPYGE